MRNKGCKNKQGEKRSFLSRQIVYVHSEYFMNKVIVTGRISTNLELKTFGESKVVNFGLAIKEKETLFVDCTAWNKTAEMLCKYTSKGASVLIEGKLDKNKYVNKNGNSVERMFILAERIEFLSFKNQGAQDE